MANIWLREANINVIYSGLVSIYLRFLVFRAT